jgi:hypothetical protein
MQVARLLRKQLHADQPSKRTSGNRSDDRGLFSFTALQPARYRLEAERAGFKRFVLEPIEVRVQLFVSAQPILEVGATTERIDVKGQVALIDPNTSSLSQVVENQQITQLPVNGRNTLAFVALTPGVNIQAGFGDNPATVNFQAWGNFQANGGVAGANTVLVDGAAVNGLFNGIGYLPPIDATQEFRVQTNNFPPSSDALAEQSSICRSGREATGFMGQSTNFSE